MATAQGARSSGGSLATSRTGQVAAGLPNGKVLVIGGESSTAALSSVELYDPATNTWAPAGHMINDRYLPSAALLSTGKVLVAGGVSVPGGNGSATSSAELYDPVADRWTSAASMAAVRYDASTVVLGNGKVLVAGGVQNYFSYTETAAAELYDPATATWSDAGSLTTARRDGSGVLLPNGTALVVAGLDGSRQPLASAEIYDRSPSGSRLARWLRPARTAPARSSPTAPSSPPEAAPAAPASPPPSATRPSPTGGSPSVRCRRSASSTRRPCSRRARSWWPAARPSTARLSPPPSCSTPRPTHGPLRPPCPPPASSRRPRC